MQTIGILGSGPAGRTLAGGFLRLGHRVMVGSRTPGKLDEWLSQGGSNAATGTFAETASFADVAILSALGTAAEDVVRLAGAVNLAGKVLIDASDPLDFSSGRPGLFVGTTDSLGERIQRLVPDTFVVKALNTVLAEVMVNPALSGGDPDMFIAGEDAKAKQVVTDLLVAFGWPVVDLGGIENARWLEAMSLAWVVHSHKTGKMHHAFKLVGK
ncbi:NAD(P)-binding domain-containing protein [Tabrizicola sp.]|uniref:NADPH-dependent F420 reductase n=1 Tax=Tabrizicola sp. TaxID=2005166 RepID=UPI00286D6844|nr:NAD(P)-binding domain-containing protein [Tabrizicola sp.]